ncbi:MAG: threonylcarbamoyl-AMP synthase [Anaerolineae bacterium]|nr:threonylcarbamoyl-AMP synthase [Anaerolineae bacterium]NUQ04727.1 threonylcarbamoyl-AMP synthase [Anaerolineae bacterium]
MITPVLPASPESIRRAAAIIRGGGLVAFPTETVYGLGANATDAEAVARIFAAKDRPLTDPVIVHIAEAADLDGVARDLPPAAHTLTAAFMPGALTLILRRAPRIPAVVAAGGDTVAVRIPSHPVAQALIRESGVPIAAPSANTFSRPSATTAAHVLEDLDGRIDLILDGNAATIGVESTILDLTVAPPTILRPGGIPVEAIRALLPNVQVATRYLGVETAAAAPGQMLRHYAPRAALTLYTGADDDATLARMRADIAAAQAAGRRVGILVSDDAAHLTAALTADLGTALEVVSARLFAALRDLDAQGVDLIFVRWTRREGLGAAIWDRLVRASNGRVIVVQP